MATKAADRAREWLVKKIEEKSDDEGYTVLDFPDLLADYEATTIERCAQIADALAAAELVDLTEFRRIGLSGCAMQAQDAIETSKKLAAAIRSMGDAT